MQKHTSSNVKEALEPYNLFHVNVLLLERD